MGTYIFKADRDLDLYCIWDFNSGYVQGFDSRAAILDYGVEPDRVERADEKGTSSKNKGDTFGHWDGVALRMHEPLTPDDGHVYDLPRDKLGQFIIMKLSEAPRQKIHALLRRVG